MGSYRSRLDIIADMLLVVSQRAKKTQIMYRANLSYKLLTEYLNEIKKSYLVRFERKEQCYVLTSKGEQFLERYKEYSRLNRHVRKQLDDVNGEREALEKLCSNTKRQDKIDQISI